MKPRPAGWPLRLDVSGVTHVVVAASRGEYNPMRLEMGPAVLRNCAAPEGARVRLGLFPGLTTRATIVSPLRAGIRT